MKSIGIPSSKYQLCLEDDQKQWHLRLRIEGAIEEELPLTHIEEKNFKDNIIDILSTAQLSLNQLQIDMLHKELWKYVENKLNPSQGSKQYGVIQDPRYAEAIQKIEILTSEIEKLTQRISQAEMKLT